MPSSTLCMCVDEGIALLLTTQVERKHAAENAEKVAEAKRVQLREACVEQGVDAGCFPPAQPWSLFPWREQLQPGSDVEEGLRRALELREPLELREQLDRARGLGFTPRGCPQFFAAEELLGQLRYDEGTLSETMEGDSSAALDPVEGRALGRKALQWCVNPNPDRDRSPRPSPSSLPSPQLPRGRRQLDIDDSAADLSARRRAGREVREVEGRRADQGGRRYGASGEHPRARQCVHVRFARAADGAAPRAGAGAGAGARAVRRAARTAP